MGRSLISPGPAPAASGSQGEGPSPQGAWEASGPPFPPQLPPNPDAPWSRRRPPGCHFSLGRQGKRPFRKVGAGGGRPRKLPTARFRFWGRPQAGPLRGRGWGSGRLRPEPVPIGAGSLRGLPFSSVPLSPPGHPLPSLQAPPPAQPGPWLPPPTPLLCWGPVRPCPGLPAQVSLLLPQDTWPGPLASPVVCSDPALVSSANSEGPRVALRSPFQELGVPCLPGRG